MSRIQILPKHLADKIAAGEVVERPASVVKELIENALDANSAKIEVAIKDAGRAMIKVVDDGHGIDADDLKLAALRHATSKIKVDSDLTNITTLGFRGEALASISAVSFLKILSRTKAQEAASSITVEGGEVKSAQKSARSIGTTVEVKNLFFNTPARLKFLKSKATETAHIVRNMNEIALAHPEISLKLLNNGEEIITTQLKIVLNGIPGVETVEVHVNRRENTFFAVQKEGLLKHLEWHVDLKQSGAITHVVSTHKFEVGFSFIGKILGYLIIAPLFVKKSEKLLLKYLKIHLEKS